MIVIISPTYYFLIIIWETMDVPICPLGNTSFTSLIIILTNHPGKYLAVSGLVLSPEKYHHCWHWSSDKFSLHNDHKLCEPPRAYVPNWLIFHFLFYLDYIYCMYVLLVYFPWETERLSTLRGWHPETYLDNI